jgi:hypothetical protein
MDMGHRLMTYMTQLIPNMIFDCIIPVIFYFSREC